MHCVFVIGLYIVHWNLSVYSTDISQLSCTLLFSNSFSNDNFMNGLYRMFLGDARPNAINDEWVFSDVDSIQEIIIPAARIALKVHQVKGRQTHSPHKYSV